MIVELTQDIPPEVEENVIAGWREIAGVSEVHHTQTLFENPRNPSFVPRWVSSGQFLRGAGGIALALLAATEGVSPEWAGALMLPWRTLTADGGRIR